MPNVCSSCQPISELTDRFASHKLEHLGQRTLQGTGGCGQVLQELFLRRPEGQGAEVLTGKCGIQLDERQVMLLRAVPGVLLCRFCG